MLTTLLSGHEVNEQKNFVENLKLNKVKQKENDTMNVFLECPPLVLSVAISGGSDLICTGLLNEHWCINNYTLIRNYRNLGDICCQRQELIIIMLFVDIYLDL